MKINLIFSFLLIIVTATTAFTQDAPPNAELEAQSAGVKAGNNIIDFDLIDLSGKQVKSAELRKDKAFILSITPPGTSYTDSHVMMINELNKYFSGKAVIADLARRPKENQAVELLLEVYQKHKVTFTILLDTDGKVSDQYGHVKRPVIVVADTEGKITKVLTYGKGTTIGSMRRDIITATNEALGEEAFEVGDDTMLQREYASRGSINVRVGDGIIDFKLHNFTQIENQLSELCKDKILILSITPPETRYTDEHIMMLSQLTEAFLENAIVVDVISKPTDTIEDMLGRYERLGAAFTALLDHDGNASALYGNIVRPVVIIADKEGKIRHIGRYGTHTKAGVIKKIAVTEVNKILGIAEEEE